MTHRMVLIVALAALGAAASGCVTMGHRMGKWVGATDSDVAAKWGAPARSELLSDGTRVMTWVDGRCEQSFVVGRDGTIASWSTHHCPKLQFGLP